MNKQEHLNKLKWSAYKGKKTHEHLIELYTIPQVMSCAATSIYCLFANSGRYAMKPQMALGCVVLNASMSYFKDTNNKTVAMYESLLNRIDLTENGIGKHSDEYDGDFWRLTRFKADIDEYASPNARMMYKWKTKYVIAHSKSKFEPML